MLLYFVSVVCVYKDILTDMSHYSLCIYTHTHKDIYTHKGMCNQGLNGMGKGGGGYSLGCGQFLNKTSISLPQNL